MSVDTEGLAYNAKSPRFYNNISDSGSPLKSRRNHQTAKSEEIVFFGQRINTVMSGINNCTPQIARNFFFYAFLVNKPMK